MQATRCGRILGSLVPAVVVWLAIGAIGTTLVAWALMFSSMPAQPGVKFRIGRDLGWIFPGQPPPGVGHCPDTWSGKVWSRTGRVDMMTDSEIYYNEHYTWPSWCKNGQNAKDPPPSWWSGPTICPTTSPALCFGLDERYVGWPLLALHSREWVTQVRGIAGGLGHPYDSGHGGTIATEGLLALRGLKFVPAFVRNQQLPLLPIWPGFALNTIFYAAIAWGVWQVPLAIRRRRRRARGECVRCGYDLKGLAHGSPCPECGLPAASAAAKPTA